MAKGNPKGSPGNLPNIPLSTEEMDQIDLLSRYRESFSHEDIARVLNTRFPDHNHGQRTGKGVQGYLNDPQRKEKRAAAFREAMAQRA